MGRFATLVLLSLLLVAAVPSSAAGVTYENIGAMSRLDMPAPIAVCEDRFGNSYFASIGVNTVWKMTPAWTSVRSYGTTGSGDGQLSMVWDVDVDRWGNLYVSEIGNDRVSVFRTSDGSFLGHIGDDAGPQQLVNPYGVGVSPEGLVYVADSGYVKRFGADGTHMGQWSNGAQGIGLDADDDGNVLTSSDQANPSFPVGNVVRKYDRDGALLASWGGTGTANGLFDRPYGIEGDPVGRVFVSEYGNDRV